MAKKLPAQPIIAAKHTEAPPVVEKTVLDKEPFNYKDIGSWLLHFNGQAIIVALLAFILYANTFQHEFAHDDGIVIVKNE